MSSTLWQFPNAASAASKLTRQTRALLARPFVALAAAGQRRARRWARKRQGPDASSTTLTSGRVYILPTGVGLVYALTVFAMLLGSMNYNNNLAFGLTFLLAALGLVSMHVCQRTLVGLELTFAGADPVFAGQTALFRIAISNPSRNYRCQIQIYAEGTASDIANIEPGASEIFELKLTTDKRGWISLPRFGVRSLYPLELFRSWGWLHMDLAALVYPRPAEDALEPPPTRAERGHRQHDARGEEDFAGLRQFNPGDSPRHVAWKAYARTGELLSKRFSGADTSSQWLDFEQIRVDDLESRLSILTRWIVDADRGQRDYGLRLPGAEFAPGHGERHRHRCLEALALFNEPKAADSHIEHEQDEP